MKVDAEKLWKDLQEGLKAPISSKKRIFGASSIAFLSFSFMVLSANPEYSLQMMAAGLRYWPLAFRIRLLGIFSNAGYAGISLIGLFSLLVGVTMTNTAIQLKMNRISLDSLGALPGFLASGCASCGVGVLSILGFGGVLASMPFQGNLLRVGGILFLTILIARTGNPETCEI